MFNNLATRFFLFGLFISTTPVASAQIITLIKPVVTLPLREVSGLVKDSLDNPISNVNLRLVSGSDTLFFKTNEEGIFVFNKVKSPVFTITASKVGYESSTTRYLNGYEKLSIAVEPITLYASSYTLNSIQINSKQGINFKKDTIEYIASDYRVRQNATVDELLKKMPGMELASDGSLWNNGQAIKKARLNGKDFAGGNVAQTIQTLPADIVEKIQVIDDYGQKRTAGLRNNAGEKIINIVTKASKSVGNLGLVGAGNGNYGRYDYRLLGIRINGNQEIGFIGKANNQLNGVANLNSSGASDLLTSQNSSGPSMVSPQNTNPGNGGSVRELSPVLVYRDQMGKNFQFNSFYKYGSENLHLVNSSNSLQLTNLGALNQENSDEGDRRDQNHQLILETDYDIGKADFLSLSSNLSANQVDGINQSNVLRTGLIHQASIMKSETSRRNVVFGTDILYQHNLKKNNTITLQMGFDLLRPQSVKDINAVITYFKPETDQMIQDSSINTHNKRINNNRIYRASLTYGHFLNNRSKVIVFGSMERSYYSSTFATFNAKNRYTPILIDSLTNSFDFSFLETRISVSYGYLSEKLNLTAGISLISANLNTRIFLPNAVQAVIFKLIPVFSIQYQPTATQTLSFDYSGQQFAPLASQLQPIIDYSDSQNPKYGNPSLKPSFIHNISAAYSRYFPNESLNLYSNLRGSLSSDQIVNNLVTLSDNYASLKTQTHYLNVNGARSLIFNYGITKQTKNQYSIELNGTVNYDHVAAYSNSVEIPITNWRINERFGPRFYPSEHIEFYPYLSHELSHIDNASSNQVNNNNTHRTAVNLDGKIYFFKDYIFDYGLSQLFIRGISEGNSVNPLVVTLSFKKEFFKKKNGSISIRAFDLFNQNTFVYRTITALGYIDSKTNSSSRYFLLSMHLNIQKWTGVPSKNGQTLMRRGDGSFIY